MASQTLIPAAIIMFLEIAPVPVLAQSQPCAIPDNATFGDAARIKFECSSTRPLQDGAGQREFVVKLPSMTPPLAGPDFPWKNNDPIKDPSGFLKALLEYGIKDNQKVDWRIEDNNESEWCHAPWFQDRRERLRGMTPERGSRPLELHALQSEFKDNWAIGFYNDVACGRLGLMWQDTAFPKTKDFVFPEGSYAIKLLFTQATPVEVPYLAGSLEWAAATGNDGQISSMRLLQVDVAVKDRRLNGVSGWFFGTFMYDANTPGNTPFERLAPVGLTWGNDPTLTAFQYEERAAKTVESWINPAVAQKFFPLPRHNLGLFGRLNGPVDNPKSSCVACHGQALDWGRAIGRGTLAEQSARLLLPGPPRHPSDDGLVGNYFRNLGTSSYVAGTQPLDYSLQVAIGIENFRAWTLAEFPDMVDLSTDVPKFIFPSDPFENLSLRASPSIEMFER